MQTVELNFTELDWVMLHDAICEGRRDDAIDILNGLLGGQSFVTDGHGHPMTPRMRSIAEQRRLFPDRVP